MYIYEMKKERAHLAKQIAKLQKDLELLPNQKLSQRTENIINGI